MTLRPTIAALATLGVVSLAIHDTMAQPPKPQGWLDIPKWVIEQVERDKQQSSIRVKDQTPFPNASRRILPPEQYDRPYKGVLTITRVATEKDVTAQCSRTKWSSSWPYRFACATLHKPLTRDGFARCDITMVADTVIYTAGFTPEHFRRHEIAHCNGWGNDHAGE